MSVREQMFSVVGCSVPALMSALKWQQHPVFFGKCIRWQYAEPSKAWGPGQGPSCLGLRLVLGPFASHERGFA